MNHKKASLVSVSILGIFSAAVALLGADGTNLPSGSNRPDLEYLKAVNLAAPPQDPQLLFLLMGEFANANMQSEGVEFFSARLKEFDPRLTGGQVFVVNWIAGMVRAQLPNRFHQGKAAQEELAWCVENVEKAPHPAWLREVYYQMAKLASASGDRAKSQDYLRRS